MAFLSFASLLGGCALFQEPGERGVFVNGEAVAPIADDTYEQGRHHLLSGHYGLAVQRLRAALRVRPDSPEILNALGVAYEKLGRSDISHGYFARALALDPGSAQTLNNIARALMGKGSIALARSYLQRAAALEPENPVISSNMQLLVAVRKPDAPAGPALASSRAQDPWIERASPRVQTLVTRPAGKVADRAVASEALPPLPLVSFVKVSVATEPAAGAAASGPPVRLAAATRVAGDRIRRISASLSIANGNGRTRMAARMGAYLEGKGWNAARLLNADHFGYAETMIVHRTGFAGAARELAAVLPVKAEIREGAALPADVLLRIGRDLLPFDDRVLR